MASRSGQRARWLLAAALIIVLLAPVAIWWPEILALTSDRQRLVAAVRGAGPAGPLVLIGLTIAQVIVGPIPGQAINFVAGYLYGFWLGTLYSWSGSVIGSTLAMILARLAGRPLLNRILKTATLDRLDRLANGKGLGFFFTVFLIPFLPDDMACFLAGLTPLPIPALVATAAAGRLPGIVAAVWAGTQAESLGLIGWLALAALSVAVLVFMWRYGEQAQDALLRFIQRQTNRRRQ